MEKENKSDGISRRNVLRSCATGAGVGISGLSGNAIAKRGANGSELKEFERTAEVQSILEELGLNRIPRRGTAETTELDGESFTLKTVQIDLGYGTLLVGSVDDEISAAFTFDSDAQKKAPNKKYDDIPTGVDAWLLGTEDEATFLRTATDEEREAALSAASLDDHESILVYTRSDIEGLHVDVLDPESVGISPDEYDVERVGADSTTDSTDVPTTEFIRYNIIPEETTAASVSPESATFEPEFISSAAKVVAKKIIKSLGFAGLGSLTDNCAVKAVGCVASFSGSIAGCLKCSPACVGSPTGVGAVICVLCVFGVCSHLLSGVSCANAMDCFEGV